MSRTHESDPLRLRVPASTSNLGTGFDALGLALSLHLEVEARPLPEGASSELERGAGCEAWPEVGAELLSQSYQRAAVLWGGAPPLRLSARSEIPVGRGLGSSAAAILMLWLDQFGVGTVVDLPDGANKNLYLGALGLGVGASLGAWFEFILLTRGLRQRIPVFQMPWRRAGGHFLRALLTALPPLGLWYALTNGPGLSQSIFVQALLVLPAYVVAYLGIAWLRRAPELRQWIGR